MTPIFFDAPARGALCAFLLLAASASAAQETKFESWTVTCADAAKPSPCRIATEAPAAGARAARLVVTREAKTESAARLAISLVGPESATPRPRIEIAVDGGPPVRFASGSDLSSGVGAEAGTVDLGLSEAATRRLLPFLRRGKTLQASVLTEDGSKIAADFALAGFADAVSQIDGRQQRKEKDALKTLIGAAAPGTLSGRLRDVGRADVPDALKKMLVARDCPVWDQAEQDASFLAEASFAADLGQNRTLWAIVCAAGSYNADFALFIEDPSKATGRFDPLLFAAFVEAIGWTGADTLANVTYDPEKRELKAFDKGRGQGDCGQFGIWEWVGAAFRMVEYRAKEECDGVGKAESFPIVFRGER